MNIKDRQTALYYLRNVVNSEYEPEDPGMFFHQLTRMSAELFGFGLYELLNNDEKRVSQRDRVEFVTNLLNGKLCRNSLLAEDDLYARVSNTFNMRKSDFNTDITDPEFDKNFTLICDTFDLDTDCRRLLQFLVFSKKNTQIRRLICHFNSEGINNDFMDDMNADFVSAVCKVPADKIKEIMSQTGELVESGILKHRYGDNSFSSMFLHLLTMNFNSCNDVRDVLIGSPLVATLQRENFDYMLDDFDKTSDILVGGVVNNKKGINILLYGRPGTGKTEIAKTICNMAGMRLYTTSENQEDKEARLSNLAHLQTVLKKDDNSVILFDEAEDVFSLSPFSRNTPSKLYVNRVLENNQRPVIWITNNLDDIDKAYVRRFSMALEMSDPDERAKINTWKRIFQKYELEISDTELKRIVNKYQVPLSIIDTAVKNAKMVNDYKIIDYTIDNLTQAMTGKLAKHKKTDGVKFDMNLLNTDTNLEKLANQIKDKNLKTFSLCLYGAPGTGKTAFCEHLAELLEINIIKKRASDIKGPYVGETERNIARAFKEAHAKKAMLVFDEADSFLQDRTNARASWEVSTVNEMLTQMENAEYPFICTTNLMDNIDKAALRRFSFKVKYDFMTQSQVVTAFQDFFIHTVSMDEVADLVSRTPGDFAVVKKQADLLGITDKLELLAKLRQEQQVKNIRPNKPKIGF
ncbi:MAG: ATP-binding protein [Alphaproteobacteria bacterium]|nr:ATP-binding protein [Alphaproteobacteria bacterium]